MEDPQVPSADPLPIREPVLYQGANTPIRALLTPKVFLILGAVFLLFIIIGIGMIVVGNPSRSKKVVTPSPASILSPTIPPTPTTVYPTSFIKITTSLAPSSAVSLPPQSLKTYPGKYVTFSYPSSWSPIKGPLFGGIVLENITLGIPQVMSDQSVSFSDVTVEQARPKDMYKETVITLGGKKGYKWIRKGDTYISYDYFTSGYQNKGSFSVHVTVSQEDKALEQTLDALAQSITFK